MLLIFIDLWSEKEKNQKKERQQLHAACSDWLCRAPRVFRKWKPLIGESVVQEFVGVSLWLPAAENGHFKQTEAVWRVSQNSGGFQGEDVGRSDR